MPDVLFVCANLLLAPLAKVPARQGPAVPAKEAVGVKKNC